MKNNLTAKRLIDTGATHVGAFVPSKGNYHTVEFEFAKGKDRNDLSKRGFYLIVADDIAVARTFVGDQETKIGFNDTVQRVKSAYYSCAYYSGVGGAPTLIYRGVSRENKIHTVYHVPLIMVTRLLTMHQFSLFEENLAKSQSLTCVSRQLFKLYNFKYQQR